MREIKFRAWDKQENKMWFNVQEFQSFTDLDGKSDYCGFHRIVNDDRFILLQYTGLKDKNGKEVYERDILLQFPGSTIELKYLITWKSDRCGFYMLHKGNEESNLALGDYREGLQVIGNIYENPELLEGVNAS